jgi:DNA-binding MarR family transcriptional regulator
MRARNVRLHRLDLDHYFLLEAVATGRAHSEAAMVLLLGRDASFGSRAVDRLVERGWLKKQPKPRGDDSRFHLKLTRKGTGIYHRIQAAFVEQVNRRLAVAPTRPKNLAPVLKQVAIFSQMLFGLPAPGDTIGPEENGMVQQPIPGLEGGGPEVGQ